MSDARLSTTLATAAGSSGASAAAADAARETSISGERAPSLAYRSYVLAVLVLVYTFNFIDRQIVGILAVPIKTELHLSDSQLGMMGGLAFALFYTLLGIPIARLADRVSRTGIMTAALALWSLMTAVCGLTHNFAQLFLARVGVGVGEAGGVAPAYSLICDYFPSKERARALSVYSFGIPIGSRGRHRVGRLHHQSHELAHGLFHRRACGSFDHPAAQVHRARTHARRARSGCAPIATTRPASGGRPLPCSRSWPCWRANPASGDCRWARLARP